MRTLFFSLALVFAAACGDDGQEAPKDGSVKIDAPMSDASGTPDANCFTNPTTHDQIINACTTAQKIYKTDDLPLLNPDGTLPDLPN